MVYGSVGGFSCSSGDFIVTMTKIVTQSAIVGALAFSAFGVGAGVANADQLVPSSPGMTWSSTVTTTGKTGTATGTAATGIAVGTTAGWRSGVERATSRAMRRGRLGAAGRLAVGSACGVGLLTAS